MSLPSEVARFRADYHPENPRTIAFGLGQILALLPPKMVAFLGDLGGIKSIDISDYQSGPFLGAEYVLNTQSSKYSNGFLAEIKREGGPLLLVVVHADDHESDLRPLVVYSLKVGGNWIEIMKSDLTLERFENNSKNLESLKAPLKEILGVRVYGETFLDLD